VIDGSLLLAFFYLVVIGTALTFSLYLKAQMIGGPKASILSCAGECVVVGCAAWRGVHPARLAGDAADRVVSRADFDGFEKAGSDIGVITNNSDSDTLK
jgi:hypothetical protein